MKYVNISGLKGGGSESVRPEKDREELDKAKHVISDLRRCSLANIGILQMSCLINTLTAEQS